MNQKEKITIKELVEKGNLEKALESFDEFIVQNSMLNDEVTQLKARLNINKKHELRDTLDTNKISIENNKITKSILSLLDYKNDCETTYSYIHHKPFYLKRISVSMLSFFFIAILYYCFSFKNEKVIVGKVYFIEEGIEKPVHNCLVKIANFSGGISGKTNKEGQFELLTIGKNIQELEFRLHHSEFENLNQKVPINFRTLKDTVFSKEFELILKEKVIDNSFLNLRNQLYKETTQVLGYLTSELDYKSNEYKDKIKRFWQLYNVELLAVETKEVEMQMVEIGKVISRINDSLDNDQFVSIRKELCLEAYDLAQIFKREQLQK